MPIRGNIHADHRLVEPTLGFVGETRHWQVGAELHDGLDIGAVDGLMAWIMSRAVRIA